MALLGILWDFVVLDLWPLVIAAGGFLLRMFSSRMGLFISSALVWLGLSVTSYKFAVAPFTSLISGQLGSAGFLVNWMGFFGVDKAITIVLSAIAAKYAIAGAKVALTKRAA